MKKLRVCERCLMAIESREGTQRTQKIYIDDIKYYSSNEEYETESRCDWCEESSFDILYEID